MNPLFLTAMISCPTQILRSSFIVTQYYFSWNFFIKNFLQYIPNCYLSEWLCRHPDVISYSHPILNNARSCIFRFPDLFWYLIGYNFLPNQKLVGFDNNKPFTKVFQILTIHLFSRYSFWFRQAVISTDKFCFFLILHSSFFHILFWF